MAAKNRLDFCALNDSRCKPGSNCELCDDLWKAATDAAVEKFTSTNSENAPCCSRLTRCDDGVWRCGILVS